MALRIALVGRYYAPVRGGVEAHMENLARQMARRGHHVEVFTGDTGAQGNPLPPEEERDGILVHRVGSPREVSRRVAAWKGDLVHFHLIRNPWVALSMRALRGDPRPKVFTPHCVYPPRSLLIRLVKLGYDPTLGRMSLRLPDRVICLTENDRQDVIRMGADPARIRMVPNCMAEERFQGTQGEPGAFRAHYRLDRYLLYVGRIDWVKGLDHILEAMVGLRDTGVRFAAVGEDFGHRARLEARARSLGVEGRVVFTGPIEWDLLVDAYRGAEAFLLPSRYEGLPTALLEAMYMGRPVITTPDGGTRYVVEDGVDGLLVRYGHPEDIEARVREVLGGEHPDMGRRAREKVQARYTWSRAAEQMETVYKEVLG